MPFILNHSTLISQGIGENVSVESVMKHLRVTGKRLLFFLFFLCISFILKAQDYNLDSTFLTPQLKNYQPKLRVRNIIVSGNKKTKEYVILREMQIKKGDSIIIDKLNRELEKAHDFIYNTTLFAEVNVLPHIVNAYDMDILITVKEKWYIFPIPYLELADRSFNEWVETYDADFSRLSYGIFFSHLNFSGRRDQLSLIFINGFKRNISVEYIAPYTNPALTDGTRFEAGFEQTREIPFATDYNNKLLYYNNDGFVKNEWFVTAAYSSRKKLKKKETFSIKFRHINVADSIISKYNPGYFNQNSSTQNFLEFEYRFQYEDVDNILYPLKGNTFLLSIKKRGFQLEGGINRFSIESSFNKYFSYLHQWYSSIRFTGEIKLPFKQPYYNLQALGYKENYIRGLEYFVTDGVAFALGKMDVKKKLAHFNIPAFINSKILNKIPFTLYAKTFADMGYVYSRFDSKLNNRFLYSGGFGIDILTLYDFKISVEYSVNQLGQKGLFLHQ